MRKSKRAKLEAAGWRVGSASDLLGLTPQEDEFVELKLALATHLRALRSQLGMTQAQAAHRLGSSQSRVAKMEVADPSVSLDLLVRALLVLGASRKEIARVIASRAA
jgi:DNA-binding XRE family transcriptional regulator